MCVCVCMCVRACWSVLAYIRTHMGSLCTYIGTCGDVFITNVTNNHNYYLYLYSDHYSHHNQGLYLSSYF
jgi:hypothetical protein